jgi:hypothetical protein
MMSAAVVVLGMMSAAVQGVGAEAVAVATAAVVGMMSATAHGVAAEAAAVEAGQGTKAVMIITAGATPGGAMAAGDGSRQRGVPQASVATLSPIRIGEEKAWHNVRGARV